MNDPPTPEEDILLAQRALAQGDHPHAARHVAMALASDPTRSDWRSLFEQIVAEAPDTDMLLPLDNNPYYGQVAGRAFILAHSGRLREGLDLIMQVARAFPNLGYLSWAPGWIDKVSEAPLGLQRVMALIADQTSTTVGRLHLRPTEIAALKHLVDTIDALMKRPEVHEDPSFLAIASGLYRRVGRCEAAVEAAQAGLALDPTWFGWVALGLARRRAGDFEGSVEAFRSAEVLDPEDLSVVAEQGRAHWEAEAFDEALRCFSKVAEASHRDAEVLASRDYLSWRLRGDEEGQWVADHTGERAVPDDMRLLCTHYVGWLPEPVEATVNTMRQLLESRGPRIEGSLKVTVTAIEAPSVHLSLGLMCTVQGEPQPFGVEVTEIQSPDPRTPLMPVEPTLWHYEGTDPTAALPPPPQDLVEAIAGLARTTYYLPRWWATAEGLAATLSQYEDAELLAAMVHPPTNPDSIPPYVWVQRLQIATALVIARLDGGWAQSRRRRLLLAAACGPVDWCINAAIIAMAEVALEHPPALEEVSRLLEDLAGRAPKGGECCYAEVVSLRYLQLPARPKGTRAFFERFYESFQESQPDPS